MGEWSAAHDRVFALPSGTLIRGRGLRAHPEIGPDPDFGLYLLTAPVQGVPWAHEWVDWIDFGLPVEPGVADRAIRAVWERAKTQRVEVACLGGLGRTGTVLACLATLDGLKPAAAIEYVRSAYDPGAVETAEQARYVSQFAARNARAVRASAYVVCVHEGHILLSHQVSAGPAQGKWTLPGGGIDFGEEPAAAAVRECAEETGLTPTIGPVIGIHSNTYESGDGVQRHGIRILYAGSFPGGRPAPISPNDGEIDEVAWFSCDTLPDPVTEWVTVGMGLALKPTQQSVQATPNQRSSGLDTP